MGSTDSPNQTLSIIDNRTGQSYVLPIERNAVHAIDFRQIRGLTNGNNSSDLEDDGLRLFDPGYQNTACLKSEITLVEGAAGQISYRGIPVVELYRSGRPFEHVAFLLIYGHLPNAHEATHFNRAIGTAELPPQSVFDMIQTLPTDAHPTTAIAAAFTTYITSTRSKIPAACGKNLYKGNLAAADEEIPQFLSTGSVIAAAVLCHLQERKFQRPKPEYSYVENFLHMMSLLCPKTGRPYPHAVSILSRLWILTANHELNNSTAAFMHAASTLSDPYSCLAASVLSSTGILHGGAGEVAYKQLEEVGDVSNVPALIRDVKAGQKRLFGYGHRMYKIADPRALPIQELIEEASMHHETLRTDRALLVAQEIDRIASQDQYFVSRQLAVNPELFISFVYKGIGIPATFSLVVTGTARAAGLAAHWREVMADPVPRLWRPLQIYTGNMARRNRGNNKDDVDGQKAIAHL
ncbi:related to citrate synthase [Rhynchosporium graminicola]|uniref:Citrate synthase n=1 Tax=Rhynchosporium graminicola TaxID=2792576 RepID=A0A1E1LJF5_9HELO|nr:related to citrate synthase [Rhynchosporium commune]